MKRPPLEVELYQRLELFSADALGIAPLSVELSRRIVIARNVVQAYLNRKNYRARDDEGNLLEGENWATWATEYPEQNELLCWAEKLAAAY